MQVTLKEAYDEACRIIGEQTVASALAAKVTNVDGEPSDDSPASE